MSDDAVEEQIEEKKEELPPLEPLEVKIVNKEGVSVVKPKSDYDEMEANEYENMYPSKEQIVEYESETE